MDEPKPRPEPDEWGESGEGAVAPAMRPPAPVADRPDEWGEGAEGAVAPASREIPAPLTDDPDEWSEADEGASARAVRPPGAATRRGG